MSRRDTFNLSKAIDDYKESKDRENAIKKANTAMNESIKNYMSKNGMDEASSDMYTAVLSNTTKESLNEDLAIAIIKENLGGALLSSVIKQKEYIDEDALEKLVYNGDFEISKLEKAKITKVTTTLRIKKKN